ncbi:hypothetical protein DKG74_20125 [Zavarzinia aquatilis]|uniref:histidine kinase n=1 Tax=Zavarzinia aquatilis TaxID=2211142 RepID=A0A317DVL4_9PROT|nr:hypothetical protein DKG74_20125 [Zavarzinia aquatilis]
MLSCPARRPVLIEKSSALPRSFSLIVTTCAPAIVIAIVVAGLLKVTAVALWHSGMAEARSAIEMEISPIRGLNEIRAEIRFRLDRVDEDIRLGRMAEAGLRRFALLAPDGTCADPVRSGGQCSLWNIPDPSNIVFGDDQWASYTESAANGEGIHFLARRFEIQDGGGFSYIVSRNIQALHDLDAVLRLTAAGSLLVLSLMGIFLGWYMSRPLLHRIAEINAFCDRYRFRSSAGVREKIPTGGGYREIEKVAENIDGMLLRLEGLMESFNVSTELQAHELGNSLTKLRNNIQRLETASAEDAEEIRRDCIYEIFGLDKLFRSLWQISRARAETGARWKAMDLRDLVVQAVSEINDSLKADIVVAHGVCSIPFFGNEFHIRQMLNNILANALKYSPPDMQVGIWMLGAERKIRIADRGPGIPVEERDKVFLPYYRMSVHDEDEGTGLGLSLVSAVASRHGIQLRLDDNRPGLIFELRFPAPQVN